MMRRGLGVDPNCLSLWTWLGASSCWAHPVPTWQSMQDAEATGPPAPTAAQLAAVQSGAMSPDQLTQQLANQQAAAQQAANASQVTPVTDIYSAINAGINAAAPGAAPGDVLGADCSQSYMASICDSTIYWGIGISLAVLFMFFSMRR